MRLVLKAPLSGIVVPLDEVPDPVFAGRMVGDGVSIDPVTASLTAPCDGRVVQIHSAAHAVTLASSHGVEVLMHVGLDTVQLKGRGFTSRVRVGDVGTHGGRPDRFRCRLRRYPRAKPLDRDRHHVDRPCGGDASGIGIGYRRHRYDSERHVEGRRAHQRSGGRSRNGRSAFRSAFDIECLRAARAPRGAPREPREAVHGRCPAATARKRARRFRRPRGGARAPGEPR